MPVEVQADIRAFGIKIPGPRVTPGLVDHQTGHTGQLIVDLRPDDIRIRGIIKVLCFVPIFNGLTACDAQQHAGQTGMEVLSINLSAGKLLENAVNLNPRLYQPIGDAPALIIILRYGFTAQLCCQRDALG